MSVLNDRIKQKRLDLGLTLLEVAELLDVKEATVQRYESGEIKNIKHDTVVGLAKILKTTPTYLMGWEEIHQEPISLDTSEFKELPQNIRIAARGISELPLDKQEIALKMISYLMQKGDD